MWHCWSRQNLITVEGSMILDSDSQTPDCYNLETLQRGLASFSWAQPMTVWAQPTNAFSSQVWQEFQQ